MTVAIVFTKGPVRQSSSLRNPVVASSAIARRPGGSTVSWQSRAGPAAGGGKSVDDRASKARRTRCASSTSASSWRTELTARMWLATVRGARHERAVARIFRTCDFRSGFPHAGGLWLEHRATSNMRVALSIVPPAGARACVGDRRAGLTEQRQPCADQSESCDNEETACEFEGAAVIGTSNQKAACP